MNAVRNVKSPIKSSTREELKIKKLENKRRKFRFGNSDKIY